MDRSGCLFPMAKFVDSIKDKVLVAGFEN